MLSGNGYDTVSVVPLIKGLTFDALLGDKAYDSNWITEEINAGGALVCISQRPQRKEPLGIDPTMYGWRHLVVNFFWNPRDFRRIAMRYDKNDKSFSAMIYACAAIINSR